MTPTETQIRERLHRLASDAPTGASMPPKLVSRARRQMVVTTAGRIALVVAVIAGVAVGARELTRSAPQPAHPHPVDLFAGIRGRILYPTSTGYLAVDPATPGVQVPVDGVGKGAVFGWSADGSRLLVKFGHQPGMSVVNADGSRVDIVQHAYAWGSFSPNGTSVVYGDRTGIHVVAADGGTASLLVPSVPGSFDQWPSWSPDGTLIAFYRQSAAGHSWSIEVVNADGSGQRVLRDIRGSEAGPLEWSPDGSELAFFVDPSTLLHSQVWVMNADGTDLRQLTSGPGDNVWPAWSADGSQIAFVGTDSLVAGRRELFLMNADGTNERRVAWDVQPSWMILWNHAGSG